ncbi:MAG: hypothetical protein WCK11_04250 [Candidatus Falkowbacteria bacterium]
MRIKFLKVSVIIFLVLNFLSFNTVHAGDCKPSTGNPSLIQNLNLLGDCAAYDTSSPENKFLNTIGLVVNVFLSLLGIIFIILIIYAGYNWMTAAGDKAKVDKGKTMIWESIIGLLIVLGAFAIWKFVLYNFIS